MRHESRPGTRIENGARSAYVFGEALPGSFRSPWRRARKVFLNYRHADRSLFETSEEESLDVLIRDPSPSVSAIEFELKVVYSIEGVDCFLPPVDVIPSVDGPRLVVADPHATPLMDVAVEARKRARRHPSSDSKSSGSRPGDRGVRAVGIPGGSRRRFYDLGTDRFARIETGQSRREMEQLSRRWDEFVVRVMPEGWTPASGDRPAFGSEAIRRSPLRRMFGKSRRPRN